MTHVEKLGWEKRGWCGCSAFQDACAEVGLRCRAFKDRCLVKAGDATIIAYCDSEDVILVLPLRFGAAVSEYPESLRHRNSNLDSIRWCLTDEGVAVCDYLLLPPRPAALSGAVRRLTAEWEVAMQFPDVARLLAPLGPLGDHRPFGEPR